MLSNDEWYRARRALCKINPNKALNWSSMCSLPLDDYAHPHPCCTNEVMDFTPMMFDGASNRVKINCIKWLLCISLYKSILYYCCRQCRPNGCGWCWFAVRKKYCWLAGSWWLVLIWCERKSTAACCQCQQNRVKITLVNYLDKFQVNYEREHDSKVTSLGRRSLVSSV